MSHPQALMTAVEDQEEWQPHAAEEFQQVGTVGKIAIGLLGASTVTHLLSTWSDWNTYSVVHRYLGGMPNVDDADLNRADAIAKVTAIPNVIVSVAAAVVFVIWLWRARVNSEVFSQADHRRSHGWVLASWFVPGPNLWYPKQIVDDVWIASDPKTPVYTDDLRRFRTPTLTSVWWVAWIGALAFDVVVRRFLMWMEATVGSLRGIALAGTASLVLTVVSAVAATMVIRKINHMQTTREWVPWWDQGPKLSAVPSYEVTQVPSYANDDTDEQPAISEPIAAGPALGLVREPQLQMAGPSQAPVQNPFAPTPAPQSFPGDGAAAPAAFAGGPSADDAPKWSPFAPVAGNWQDADAGPATEQFNPIETWRDEKPVEQTTYDTPQQSWEDYRSSLTADLLGTTSSWRDEAAPMTVVQPDPYGYQPEPEPQPQPAEEPWAARYSEPYSYEPDYLTSTASPVEAQTAPEPEPAPVARAGRRAARVAVDSPSAIQPAVPNHSPHVSQTETYSSYSDHNVYGPSEHTQPSSHVSASSGYYEPAPAPSYQEQDDFLTPSKPLPPVPSYGPEPTYSSGGYSDQETSYTSDYSSSYNSESYGSSNYDAYGSNGGSEYTSTESYETYSPNYATESYGSQYSPEPEPEQTEHQQHSPYAYEQQQPTDPEQPPSPRTLPRRGRWI
ncbi:DUF4328 domain-containing protein [Kribbella sp. VKM Ac-2566]|uniref:DUF4328 domain-containing protein n=1 Tax=Kribbella sp. VKM Ac-2566 TaxID=2512218 RepID=UPI0010635E4B|nr:DUF4328 domain-containing protein [Kribbella sp. VKM Ac-2566]TDX08783.1 uncharacterized protein DUF4328 [Kribbella sp. VKM Ac-2566]